MKEQILEQAPRRIKHIQFSVLSPQEIVKNAQLAITHRDLFNDNRKPMENGVLDTRLGTSDHDTLCQTCGEKMAQCIGHFGYVKLILPVFHIGYFKAVINMLQNICKTCSRVLLNEDDRRSYLKRIRASRESSARQKLEKAINTLCKKEVDCPHCGAINGSVKKVGALKIVHEKFKSKKAHEEHEKFKSTFNNAIEYTPDLRPHLHKAQEDLNAMKVLDLFKRISDDDCELLGLDPQNARPELFIWQRLPVPPVAIRPSIAQDNASTEDDLTVKLSEIVQTNTNITAALTKGVTITQLMEQWDYLQLTVAMYIHSEMPGLGNMAGIKPSRGLCQRLKGKQGRFRGNLSGKRVDFSGRTVISPDPNLRIDEVAVPELVAKILTYPERVFAHNIDKLRQCVINGADVHPGANFVKHKSGGKRFLKYADQASKDACAAELQIGDVVERHLRDDDVVLFNRQPSLHKLSIMAHYVRVKPWRTFRFNECVCSPYNADFDGDEMNLHVPQTEEARIEAIELMGVKNNLVTPRNGDPIIAAIQDFITSSYLLTKKDVFYNRAQFTQICSYMADADTHIDIPPPSIWKPMKLWTGKQIFNVLMRPNKKSSVLVNLEAKGRSFDKKEGRVPDFCPNEGYAVIQNSEIMCGCMDKTLVGDGNKHSLFYTILRDFGSLEAASAMNRLSKLCSRWLANRGFSIGINDVQPGEKLRERKEELIGMANKRCNELIEQSKLGLIENQPGCDEEQTLETHISGVLSKVRDDAGQICMTELNKYNAPLIMATCGSKGSKINVSQMVACVGQQIISGSRIPDGFQDRSLPHFPKHSKTPAARGFVRNSFYSGLSPTEFLFHAISGREGLVDTAVKTAETGYMQRKLMKALEDLTIHYDMSVRNSSGGLVQFYYGDDGLDPAFLEAEILPVDLKRNLQHIINIVSWGNDKVLLPYEIREITDSILGSDKFVKLCTQSYIESLSNFVQQELVNKLSSIRESYGLMRGDYRLSEEYGDLDDAVYNTMGSNPVKAVVNHKLKITEKQLRRFLDTCWTKFMRAKIEPGTAVGALGAQSIGEPGTQMTLKTFHFAGVASMNITLGVPRIKEIINASKTISTPIITCKLVNDTDVKSARIVKGRLETTYLGDIAKYIDEIYERDQCFLAIKLDLEAIQKLQLETNIKEIARAIVDNRSLKLEAHGIRVVSDDEIDVYISDKEMSKDPYCLYYRLQILKRALPKVIVKGIQTVTRAVISEGKGGKKLLLVEGYGLREVMTTEGIVGIETTSNNINEVHKVLGIEAARNTIIQEIQYTMGRHGMSIDPRHVMLLGDIMTFKGEVLGIHRFGISNMKSSVLMLASFEKTTDHLFDAALHSKRDCLEGVSESIIMGMPMQLGTGLFKLIRKPQFENEKPPKRKLIFDTKENHVKFIYGDTAIDDA
ncbi:beta and beta-prime subunits of DNA dependent RNA-polymerase [Rhizophagus irregularis]|uniref:DNA-directed RNA polymerase subunit n=1 Tax=Rhizophagus irregularis TaxID=588596 RepID=A0A2I1G1C5_9GLOM|nr:beta and beta-prime subunits of DNA dependent RNA-polymerase [Rhizophagus irregularis]